MSNYNENDHPRSQGGRFTTKDRSDNGQLDDLKQAAHQGAVNDAVDASLNRLRLRGRMYEQHFTFSDGAGVTRYTSVPIRLGEGPNGPVYALASVEVQDGENPVSLVDIYGNESDTADDIERELSEEKFQPLYTSDGYTKPFHSVEEVDAFEQMIMDQPSPNRWSRSGLLVHTPMSAMEAEVASNVEDKSFLVEMPKQRWDAIADQPSGYRNHQIHSMVFTNGFSAGETTVEPLHDADVEARGNVLVRYSTDLEQSGVFNDPELEDDGYDEAWEHAHFDDRRL